MEEFDSPHVAVESEAVVKFRLEHGLCHLCGTQIYEIIEGRVIPLTIEGIVKRGRCLYCYPDTACFSAGKRSPKPEVAEVELVTSQPATLLSPRPVVASRNSQAVEIDDKKPSPVGKRSKVMEYESDGDSRDESDFTPEDEDDVGAKKEGLHKRCQRPKRKNAQHNLCTDSGSDGDGRRIRKKGLKSSEVLGSSEPQSRRRVHEESSTQTSKTVSMAQSEPNVFEGAKKSNGEIQICDADGTIFKGYVTEGTTEKGKGKFVHLHTEPEWANKQAIYEGEFENGTMEGEGRQVDAAGCLYEGHFTKGAANGRGRCVWPVGWVYEGEWVDDLREGQGTCRQKDGGEVYSGEWKNDMWHGQGELTFDKGDKYIGEFRENKMHGKGRYEFSDGSIYEGNFENDFRSGKGEMRYCDGLVYVGNWKSNWREGQGKLTFQDGSEFRGTFRGDEMNSGFIYMLDGIVRPVKGGIVQS